MGFENPLEIAPSLIELARHWPTYPSSSVHVHLQADPRGGYERVEQLVDVRRCCMCHEEVYAAEHGQQVLAHLMLSHGYRMDGRQWNDRNELVGHA